MFLEFNDWPEAAAKYSVARPIHILPIEYNIEGENILLSCPQTGWQDRVRYFLKLGPKSWRNSDSLNRSIAANLFDDDILRLLKNLSVQQSIIAGMIAKSNAPLNLYIFKWQDFSQISEFRILIDGSNFRITSLCDRQNTQSKILRNKFPQIIEFARKIYSLFSESELIIDIALLPDGRKKLIEVNPMIDTPSGPLPKISIIQ